jgi:SOS-response transcriptional repressor LexA
MYITQDILSKSLKNTIYAHQGDLVTIGEEIQAYDGKIVVATKGDSKFHVSTEFLSEDFVQRAVVEKKRNQ